MKFLDVFNYQVTINMFAIISSIVNVYIITVSASYGLKLYTLFNALLVLNVYCYRLFIYPPHKQSIILFQPLNFRILFNSLLTRFRN